MKNFVITTIIMLLIQSVLPGQVLASSRVDNAIAEEREGELINISIQLDDLQLYRDSIQNIETHLKRTKKGQSIYFKVETFVGAVVIVGIVIGSYKAYFPPGFRAMLSAYVTATAISRGMIKLNDKEVEALLNKLAQLNKQIVQVEKALFKQKATACATLNNHWMCEY